MTLPISQINSLIDKFLDLIPTLPHTHDPNLGATNSINQAASNDLTHEKAILLQVPITFANGGFPSVSILTVNATNAPILLNYAIQAMFTMDQSTLDNSTFALNSPAFRALGVKVPPTNLDEFITDLRAFAQSSFSAGPLFGSIFDAMFQEFNKDLNLSNTKEANMYTAASAEAGQFPAGAPANFVASFNAFLVAYKNGIAGNFVADTNIVNDVQGGHDLTNGTKFNDFLKDWRDFMTGTAVLSAEGNTNAGFSTLPSYQAYYNAAFPGSAKDPVAFQLFLNKFVKGVVNSYGYFLPSQFYDKFKDAVNSAKAAALPSSVTGTHAADVSVLLSVIASVISFIGTIQNTGELQADYLTYLTKYQQAYNNTANNIYIFSRNDGSILGHVDDSTNELRSSYNQKGQAWAQSLRSYGSLLQDTAKQFQANINQTNEQVNQQSNLLTTIFQQLSTILQSIAQSK